MPEKQLAYDKFERHSQFVTKPVPVGSSSHARFPYIYPYVKGRTVLDLGCAQGMDKRSWMHRRVAEVSKEAVGLDLNGERVDTANSLGFNLVQGNVQDFDLGRQFDVVFGGELIEHLDNARGFLESCRKHIKPDGVLILTTPNKRNFSGFVRGFVSEPLVNKEHTCWYCAQTITQLLDRMDYDVVRIDYVPHQTPGVAWRVVANALRALLPMRMRWGTLLVVAQPR